MLFLCFFFFLLQFQDTFSEIDSWVFVEYFKGKLAHKIRMLLLKVAISFLNILNQFCARVKIYYDKNQTLLSPFSIHALCFCNFHLMLEPLEGYCCACTLPMHRLIAPKWPQWQKICMAVLVIEKSCIDSEGCLMTEQSEKGYAAADAVRHSTTHP